jgi:MraZ protein
MALTALMGTYHHNIDAKGRMSFPTKLREILGREFYVTKSINQKCLTIYSKVEWEKLAAKVAALPDSMGGLDIKRWLFSGAGELIPDNQGRVLIPADLRDFAFLKKNVVVIGLDDKAEIWDKELWDNQQNNMDMEKLLAAMQQLGI